MRPLSDIKHWMQIAENMGNPQIQVIQTGTQPRTFEIRFGDQKFGLSELPTKTILHGDIELPSGIYAIINGKKIRPSRSTVKFGYRVDFDTDRVLDIDIKGESSEGFAWDIVHAQGISYDQVDHDEYHNAMYNAETLIRMDRDYVEERIDEQVDFFKEVVGATIEEVDIHRAHASDSLLDIAENINQNNDFVVTPIINDNVLKVKFSKDSYPLGGEEFTVTKQGENTIVKGSVSSTYYGRYPSYGKITFTSHQLDVEIVMEYELNLRFPETSIEVRSQETWDSVFEFVQEMMWRFTDVPDPDTPEFEEYESEIMRDIGFDYETAKADALDQVKMFTEIVGSNFEEIDTHRTTPHDSLLDISEESKVEFSKATYMPGDNYQVIVDGKAYDILDLHTPEKTEISSIVSVPTGVFAQTSSGTLDISDFGFSVDISYTADFTTELITYAEAISGGDDGYTDFIDILLRKKGITIRDYGEAQYYQHTGEEENNIQLDMGIISNYIKADIKNFKQVAGATPAEIDMHRKTADEFLLDIPEHRNHMRALMNIFEDSKDFRVFVNDDGVLQIDFHNMFDYISGPEGNAVRVYDTYDDSFELVGTLRGLYCYYDGGRYDFMTSPLASEIQVVFSVADNGKNIQYSVDFSNAADNLAQDVVIDKETAKRHVMNVLDYIKAKIGTTYDEIYRHVDAPPDRLLDIE